VALGPLTPISLKRGGIFIFLGLSYVRIRKLYQENIEYPVDLKLFLNLCPCSRDYPALAKGGLLATGSISSIQNVLFLTDLFDDPRIIHDDELPALFIS
jgi:hypothetical protein